MENVGLFLYENQGQCVWQNDARSSAFRQSNRKCCSCGGSAVGARSVVKVRVGCGQHILEPVSFLFRLQSCCPNWCVPFIPSLTYRSPFVCGKWTGFVFFKGHSGSSVHSYFLALSPTLNCAFYVLSCRSQAIPWMLLLSCLWIPCVVSCTFWLMFCLDPVHSPKCHTSHASKDWFCHSLRAVNSLLL